MIVHKVLSSARFGNDVTDYGINNLMKRGVLEDAYPLHDGNWEWTEEGSLTDRQVLLLNSMYIKHRLFNNCSC